MKTIAICLALLVLSGACASNGAPELTSDLTGGSGDALEGSDTLGQAQPALCLDRFEFDFGVRQLGQEVVAPLTLESCGTGAVILTEVALFEGGSEDFSLDLGSLPQAPSTEHPLILEPGASVVVSVVFDPVPPENRDEGGKLLPSKGTLLITGNQPGGQNFFPLEGFGVEADQVPICPQAIIDVLPGNRVLTGTLLDLVGEHSFAPEGGLSKYRWEVEQPSGSQSVFSPTDAFPNPQFEVNVPGRYTFRLTVWDDEARQTCTPDEFEVWASVPTAFRVELSWKTPGDLDLHVANDYARGPKDCDADGISDPWFDQPFDCHAGNPEPQWGSWDPNAEDDPKFSTEQQGERTLEVIELVIPETRATYTAGVHYPEGQGLGKLSATVRIYLQDQLVREFQEVELLEGQFWWVATIAWPEGVVQGFQTNQGPKVGVCQELLPR
jgi:hypothetical protein